MKNKTFTIVFLLTALILSATLFRSTRPMAPPPPMPPTNAAAGTPLARFHLLSGEAGPLITNGPKNTVTLRLTIKTLNCEFANPPGYYAGPVPSTFSFTNTNVVTMTTSGWSGGTLVFSEYDIPANFPEAVGFGVSGYCPIRALSQDTTCLEVSGKATFGDGTSTNYSVVANLPGGTQSFHWSCGIGTVYPRPVNHDTMGFGAGIDDYSIDPFAPRPPTINPPVVVPNTNGTPHRSQSDNPYASYAYQEITPIGTNENWTFIPTPGVMQIAFYPDGNLQPNSTWNILSTSPLCHQWTNVDTATSDGNGFLQVFEDASASTQFYRISQ